MKLKLSNHKAAFPSKTSCLGSVSTWNKAAVLMECWRGSAGGRGDDCDDNDTGMKMLLWHYDYDGNEDGD